MHAANDPATACVAVLQLQNLRRLNYVQPSHARQETGSIMYATRRAALEPRWWSAITLVFWTDVLRRRRRSARRVPEPNKYYHLGAVKDATLAFLFGRGSITMHTCIYWWHASALREETPNGSMAEAETAPGRPTRISSGVAFIRSINVS